MEEVQESKAFEVHLRKVSRIGETLIKDGSEDEVLHGCYWFYFDDPRKTILVMEMDSSLLPAMDTTFYMEYPDEDGVLIHWPINGVYHKWKYTYASKGGQFCL